ncbi:unnamed protein product [Camellia sinensis]|uniref:heavy metal-associated isoprenylated plant protein 2-like n=1 Tax=Camellia sinensis TaxID=4442 RepID=UPI0010361FFC|nr:heavy metal-associated isoprenylated plant protein 2-like [Camellia sinensis]
MKKIELKVGIYCHKCKTEVLKAVTKLTGIDQVSVDAEKGTLTVIGNVDPVCVTTQVRRKTGKVVELISVGPPKPPDPKPQPCKPPICLPPCCKECELVGITFVPYYGGSSCSIL